MDHRIDVAKWPEKGDAQLPGGADTVHLNCLSMHACAYTCTEENLATNS